ncbi:unnamed protein product, partial [Dovyalis caffra]
CKLIQRDAVLEQESSFVVDGGLSTYGHGCSIYLGCTPSCTATARNPIAKAKASFADVFQTRAVAE